jgi:prevent-host-death family protein
MSATQLKQPIDVSTTEARRNFATYIKRAEVGRETFALTQHGKVRAYLVPADDYWLRRTIERLDAHAVREAQNSGPLIDVEDLLRQED